MAWFTAENKWAAASWLPQKAMRIAWSVTIALSIASCETTGSGSVSNNPRISGGTRPMVLAPGWVTGTTWPAETVVALNSVALRSTSLVSGSVGVVTRGTGAFLYRGVELAIDSNAEVTGNVRADSIDMQSAGHVFGTAAYNELIGSGTIDGTETASLSVPVPITVVAAANFTAGTTNVNVLAGATQTINPGQFNQVNLAAGTAASRTTLRLNAGTFDFADLTMGDYTRLECMGACVVRVKNRVSAGAYTFFGANSATMTMNQVQLFVEGTNGVVTPTGTPPAASFGTRSELKAYTFVPNGTLILGQGSTNVGKFIAKDVDVGVDAELTNGDATQRVLASRWVVGSTWPSETVTALNSIDILASTNIGGNLSVIQNGSGPFLNTYEAMVGSNAVITGNLRADTVMLNTGSSVTGTLSYNTRVGTAGTAGATSTPLSLPLDVRVPVFPVTTNGGKNRNVNATVNETWTAGSKVKTLRLRAGLSTNYTTLTLSGGIYNATTITMEDYTEIICNAACEIRVSSGITLGVGARLIPTTGLDVSKVKLFVYGANTPTQTAMASFGTSSTVSAFTFVPRGGIEAQSGSTLNGRFVALDVRLGSAMTQVAGTTIIAPTIQQSPQSVSVAQGQSATFSVIASGTDITFQWSRNGVPITGATSGSYTLPSVALADSNSTFSVLVANAAGGVASSSATLTVTACDPLTFVSTPTACGVGGCASAGMLTCPSGAVVDTCVSGTPAASDNTCDGIDNDCNGQTDEDYAPVATVCGLGACSATGITSCVSGVVQDSCTSSVPAANDTTCDGRDDDCDNNVDEDFVAFTTTCGVGSCVRSGTATCSNGALIDSCSPGTPGTSDSNCNGIDEDCDGQADQDYDSLPTTCGSGACATTGSTSCVAGTVVNSCRAGTGAASDPTCDGVDDDCDGVVDDNYVSVSTTCGVGACGRTGSTSCVGGAVQNSCVAGSPAASDTSCNNIDDDCSGQTDEDYVHLTTSCGVGACGRTGTTNCVSGTVQNTCTPGTPAANDAVCNGIDDDCSGQTDEDYVPTPTSCGTGACTASGQLICSGGSTVNTCVAGGPGTGDAVCNGVDDDCDGIKDEDYASVTTSCGVGACQRSGSTSCVSGGVVDNCSAGSPAANDATCNGIDDDCSGTADEDYVSVATTCGSGACASTGATSCVGGAVVDSCSPPPANADGDALLDCADACPFDAFNDIDGDGLCANVDPCPNEAANDADGDGLCASVDNCPSVANASQTDWDHDNIGDACDVLLLSSISAGAKHTCARVENNRVACWGAGDSGQIGDGASVQRSLAVLVSGVTDAVDVIAGGSHSCAIRSTGTVVCWGKNTSGQLGNGSTANASSPVPVSSLTNVVQVVLGASHSCARRATGEVLCWGANASGQLGNGTTTASSTPVAVSTLTGAVELVAGYNHTCARDGAGAVYCWGANSAGQVGNGTTVNVTAPIAVAGLSPVAELAAGDLHTCARSGGTVVCWGGNRFGALGDGTKTASLVPVAVSGLSDAAAIDAGQLNTCARRSGGTVVCWGYNSYGSIGNGTVTDATTPAAVTGLSNVSSLSVGGLHACTMLNSGEVKCWGNAEHGELGNGAGDPVSSPMAVGGISNAIGVSASTYHSCALHSTGTVSCWGTNSSGELGTGDTRMQSMPVPVVGLSGVTALSGGDAHTCALGSGGAVYCWGYGRDGALGNGSTSNATSPVAASGISGATSVAAGISHSCAVVAGDVQCWGSGSDGQLGNGSVASSSTPVTVSGISGATDVVAGVGHSCALMNTGEVYCWGLGTTGQLGNNTFTNSALPVLVASITDAVAIGAGDLQTCAVRSDSSVWCWGSKVARGVLNGQHSSVPVQVSGLTNAVSVTSGTNHACSLLNTGSMACWGNNAYGQIGNGTFANPGAPETVVDITNALDVRAGQYHNCAATGSGAVYCWGSGFGGQLGNGYPLATTPITVSWSLTP